MSLKAFHLVFISACDVLALFCGFWWIQEFVSAEAGVWSLVAGVAALTFAAALSFYEMYFIRKLKSLPD